MIKKKLKHFIKTHLTLYKFILASWGIWRSIWARFIFSRIKRRVFREALPKNNHKIIIPILRTFPGTSLFYFDAVFGYAFKKLGAEVKMLYCDGVLDSCDGDTVFYHQKAQCWFCRTFGSLVKKCLSGLDCISYKDYISNSEIQEIKEKVACLGSEELLNYHYLGVNVGSHAKASAIRYFLFGRLDLNDSRQLKMLREKLAYAMIAVKVAKNIIEREKPDKLFLLHGIYSTWGPFVDYFRLKSLDTIVYINITSRFGHFIFRRNSKANEIDIRENWLKFSQLPLKEIEKKQLKDYLTKRFQGKIADQKLYAENFDIKNKKEQILSSLSKNKYAWRYIIYPNLAWDSAVEGQISKLFNDNFDWIDTTVEFCKKKKDCQLIIKPHPAELVWEKSSKPVNQYLQEKHSPLPDNITVLPPAAPVNAYDLVTENSVALIFNGTLGLELATLGIPVLVVADVVHYKNAGVSYDIESLEEYLNLLENPARLVSFARAKKELAEKYAYFYFFKSMIRIPFFRDDVWSTIDWKVLLRPKKLLDNNASLIKVCQKIIKGEDIIAS